MWAWNKKKISCCNREEKICKNRHFHICGQKEVVQFTLKLSTAISQSAIWTQALPALYCVFPVFPAWCIYPKNHVAFSPFSFLVRGHEPKPAVQIWLTPRSVAPLKISAHWRWADLAPVADCSTRGVKHGCCFWLICNRLYNQRCTAYVSLEGGIWQMRVHWDWEDLKNMLTWGFRMQEQRL